MTRHEEAQAFLSELPELRKDLPFSTSILQRLFAQTGEDATASMAQIAETISHDQGLSTRLLAQANSAFYGLQAHVASVQRAATVLGLAEIRRIMLTVGIKAMVARRKVPAAFDLEAGWRHQYCVGMLARGLSREIPDASGLDSDTLFTAGLLHDVGKLVTAMMRPEHWTAIRTLAREQNLSDGQAENAYWGVDHSVVGSLLLRAWDLPGELTEIVNWHHAQEAAPHPVPGAMTMRLCDALIHAAESPDGPYAGQAAGLAGATGLDLSRLLARADATLRHESVNLFTRMLA